MFRNPLPGTVLQVPVLRSTTGSQIERLSFRLHLYILNEHPEEYSVVFTTYM